MAYKPRTREPLPPASAKAYCPDAHEWPIGDDEIADAVDGTFEKCPVSGCPYNAHNIVVILRNQHVQKTTGNLPFPRARAAAKIEAQSWREQKRYQYGKGTGKDDE